MPITRKRWTALALGFLGLCLLAVILLVVLIDPFEIYHKATAFIPPIANGTQNYSNAGIAHSYEYDSVIIGSSMTENFLPSQLDRVLGGHFVKLCINSGSPFNHRQMMELAFRTHSLRNVLYGIDIDLLTYFYTQPKTEMPDYLYDTNLFNDVSYWFNSSVLLRYIPQCLATWGRTDPTQRDTMYCWGDLYPYGKKYALDGVKISDQVRAQKPASEGLSQQTRLNIEYNYLPYIEAHPETQFTFFFPPYSLARWYLFYQQGMLDYHLSQVKAVTEALLPYENVAIYDFRARLDWILDLDNYIDNYHYGPWINEAMVDNIGSGIDRITDPEQITRNNESIARHVDMLVAAGAWPDSFDDDP